MSEVSKKKDFQEISLSENQYFFCTLFGATFTLTLNLFCDLLFLRILYQYFVIKFT